MRFKVPQFIDVEDKIFGPFTFTQFVYLVGGGGLVFILYKILPIWIGIFLILPVAGLTIMLVFVKINSKPFIYYLQASISYLLSDKLYLWKQRLVKSTNNKKEEIKHEVKPKIPTITENRLRELSWGLDVKDRTNEN